MKCCVSACTSGSRSFKSKEVRFFSFRRNCKKPHRTIHTLMIERRARQFEAWCKILKMDPEIASVRQYKICSRHFVSGAPANSIDEDDVDWVPSLLLDNANSKNAAPTPASAKTFEKSQTTDDDAKNNTNKSSQSSNVPIAHTRDSNEKEHSLSNEPETSNDAQLDIVVCSTIQESIASDSCDQISSNESRILDESQGLMVEQASPIIVTDAQSNTVVRSSGKVASDLCNRISSNVNSILDESQGLIVERASPIIDINAQSNTVVRNIRRVALDSYKQPSSGKTNLSDKSIPPIYRVLRQKDEEIKTLTKTVKRQKCELEAEKKLRLQAFNEMQARLNETYALRQELNLYKLGPEFFFTDSRVKFYTGLPNLEMFESILKQINPALDQIQIEHKLTNFQKLLLTFMKLRMNCTYTSLAYRFNISVKQVSAIFTKVILLMDGSFRAHIIWPDQDSLSEVVPRCFRERFGEKVFIMADCFEIRVQRPSSLQDKSQIFPNEKHVPTIKYLIAITPQGTVSFISDGNDGPVSDDAVTESCGMLEHVKNGDVILANRDASARIYVNRIIRFIRNKFKIVEGPIPMSILRCKTTDGLLLDSILRVACAVINMCEPIIPL